MLIESPELTFYLFRTIPITKSNINPRFTKARIIVQALPSPSADQALWLFGDTDPRAKARKKENEIAGLLIKQNSAADADIPILKLSWQLRVVQSIKPDLEQSALCKREVHGRKEISYAVKHVMLAKRFPEDRIISKHSVKVHSKVLLQIADELGLGEYATLPNFKLVLYPVANLFEARLPALNDLDPPQVLIIGPGPESQHETSVSTVLRSKLVMRREQLATSGFNMFQVLDDWDTASSQLMCLLRHANYHNKSKSSRSIRSTISGILDSFTELVVDPLMTYTQKKRSKSSRNKELKEFVNKLSKSVKAKEAMLFAKPTSCTEENNKLARLEEEFMRGVFSVVRYAPVNYLEEESLCQAIAEVWQKAEVKVYHEKFGITVRSVIHEHYQKLATRFQEVYYAVKSQPPGFDKMVLFRNGQKTLVPSPRQTTIDIPVPFHSRQILVAQRYKEKLILLTQSQKGFKFEQNVWIFDGDKPVKTYEMPRILINQALKLGLSYQPQVTFSLGIMMQQVFGRHMRHIIITDVRSLPLNTDQIHADSWTYVQKPISKSTAQLWLHLSHTSSHIFLSQFYKPREIWIQRIGTNAKIGNRIAFELLSPTSSTLSRPLISSQGQDLTDNPSFSAELIDPKLSVPANPPWTDPSFQLAAIEGSSLFFTAHKRPRNAPWDPANILLALYKIPRRPLPPASYTSTSEPPNTNTNPRVPLTPLCHIRVSLASFYTCSLGASRPWDPNNPPKDASFFDKTDIVGSSADFSDEDDKSEIRNTNLQFVGYETSKNTEYPASLSTCSFQTMLFHDRPYLHIVDSSKQQWSALFCVHRNKFVHLSVRSSSEYGVWGFGRSLISPAHLKQGIQYDNRGPSFLPVVCGIGVLPGSYGGHNQVIVSKLVLSL